MIKDLGEAVSNCVHRIFRIPWTSLGDFLFYINFIFLVHIMDRVPLEKEEQEEQIPDHQT